MRKLKNFLLSKSLLLVLLVAIQVSMFFIFYYIFSVKYSIIKSIMNILAILLFFSIINSDAPASSILPWAVVLLISPIIGLIIYSCFGRKFAMKSIIKHHKKVAKEDDLTQVLDEEVTNKSIYIKNSSNYYAYKNTKTKYLPTGEIFFEKLCEEIMKADKYIFLEYFIIDDGKMWDKLHALLKEKLDQGVEIIIIYDAFGSGTKVPGSFYKNLIKEGFICKPFRRLIPIASPLHNNRDHRKITIIDGKVGFIGGSNIADEYINLIHPYGHWRDSNLMLEGEAVSNLLLMFIEQYNAANNQKNTLDYKKYLYDKFDIKCDEIVQPFATGPTPIYTQRVAEINYLNIINQAKSYVYITSPYFIVDTYFIDALISAAKRNVDVRIMLPQIYDSIIMDIMARNNYTKLISNGVKIYEYKDGFIHSKSIVSDDECATIGTINFDYRSFIHHFECGVYIEKSPTIEAMKEDFLNLCENSANLVPLSKAKLNIFKKIIRNFLKIFSPLF